MIKLLGKVFYFCIILMEIYCSLTASNHTWSLTCKCNEYMPLKVVHVNLP